MRRIVLVLIIVAVLGLIAGGGWWHLHRNSGARLLGRAQLALRAQKYGRAIELAGEYADDNPEDWRGYYVQAQAHTASGRYEEARRLLDDAAEVAPNETDILLLRSDTFANPARATLRKLREDPGLPLDVIRSAIDDLNEARRVLENAYPPGHPKPLAVSEALGLLLTDLGRLNQSIRYRLLPKVETFRTAKQDAKAQEAQAEADRAGAEARQYFREAGHVLLQAVTEAAKGKGEEKAALLRRATNVLVNLPLQGEEQQEKIRRTVGNLVFEGPDTFALAPRILESTNPPLVAVTALLEHRLHESPFPRGSSGYTKQVRQACDQLDLLLERHAAHPEAMQVRLVRARLAMDLGELEKAETLCNAILKDLPHQRNARLLKALIAMERGKMAEAEEKLLALKTERGNRNWTAVKIYYARAALEIGNRERAREALRSVTERPILDNPETPGEKRLAAEVTKARMMLAQSLLADDLAEQALNEVQHVLDSSTVPPQAFYLYFWSAVCADQPGLAKEPLARGLAQYPKEPGFVRLLLTYPGFLEPSEPSKDSEEKRKKRQAEAFETLKAAAQAALEEDPGNPNALRLRVHGALATGEDHGPLLAVLRKAAKAFPDNPAVQAAVADCYTALGKSEEAKEATERMAAGVPEDLRDHLMAAEARIRLGRPAEAESVLREALQANPQSHHARALMADVYLRTGRVMQAIEQLREAVSLAPARGAYRLALARALLRAGLMEEANDHVQAVLGSNPDNADALLLANQIQVLRGETPDAEDGLEAGLAGRSGRPLAQAYLARGNAEKCIEICRNVLKEDPADIATRWLLGRALLLAGDRDGCIEQLTAALKDAPDYLPLYQSLAIVLGAEQDVARVEAALGAIPGARPDLVNLASATLLERRGQYEAAAEAYARVADGKDADANYRAIARIHKGRCLAAAGHHDLAILELDRVPTDHPLHMQAMLHKATLLGGTGKRDEALNTLKTVRDTAVAKQDATTLGRVAVLHLRLNQPEEALAVAEDAADIAPKNPQPLLLRAAALQRLDRTDEAIQCLRQAVARQPGNLGLHTQLARALENANRRLDALQALAALEQQGRTGQAMALYEKGRMFLRWGLQKRGVETFSDLADRGLLETPRVRLALANALAALGRTEQAREQLAAIPPHSDAYVPARQRLAQLADSDEQKLAILAEAEKQQPSPALAAQRIALLREAGRPAEAVKALQTYMAEQGDDAVPPLNVAMAGILALLDNQQRPEAADLAIRVAKQTGKVEMRHAATLLALRVDPGTVPDLLPPAERAGPADVLLGLCRAVLADHETEPWAKRLAAIRGQAAEVRLPLPLPVASGVLAAVAAGDPAEADTLLAEAGAADASEPSVARELVQAAKADPAVQKEAAALLGASLAIELGLPEFGRRWALETLRQRPASQWAASLAARGMSDPKALREVADLLKPDDCMTDRMLRLSILRLEDNFEAAAKMAGELAQAHQGDPEFLMAQASALEEAGRLKDALPLYEQVWQKAQDPTAANNAAYLASVLYPENEPRLQEALAWSEAAVKNAPQVGAFRDTRGWIAYLLGDYEEARRELWQAVRRIPNAPEIHYHLGMAEQKTGHTTLAQWHLQAAVDLTEAAHSAKQELTETEAEAGRLAKAALAELKGSPEP
ncbi:MAG: tetratricopeptide repeat protein [Phycisphaerae bacterium]